MLAVFRRDGLTGPVTRAVGLNQPCPATPFLTSYQGVRVECSKFGDDYSGGQVTPIRGSAATTSVVPADAVTASASGLGYQISPAYAQLQTARVTRLRGISDSQVARLIAQYTTGRTLGFIGEPGVNVLKLNLALDQRYPARSTAN